MTPIGNDAHGQIECTIPILPVRDLQRSLAFYTEQLNFRIDWGEESGSRIASVSRDGHCLMLMQRADIAEPAWVWIGLKDDSYFDLLRSRGVKVRQEPQNRPWAYEMKFEDPDGNVLWLGTEPRSDMPVDE
ncbi:MAG: VOC family protein [Planctomycetaceae bacterium]|nr:VOC family protein [Planctomycetaceae bacterium]